MIFFIDILFQEINLVFPNSHRVNRGNYVVKDLAEACRSNGISDLVVIHENRGTPGMYPYLILIVLPIPKSSTFSHFHHD